MNPKIVHSAESHIAPVQNGIARILGVLQEQQKATSQQTNRKSRIAQNLFVFSLN